MMTLEILGAIAAAITIFTAGVAVGRYTESSKNDRRQFERRGDRLLLSKLIRANRQMVAPLWFYYIIFRGIVNYGRGLGAGDFVGNTHDISVYIQSAFL